MPFIFGKPKVDEFIEFTNLIEQSKLPFNQVKNLYFFQSKRWDLELKNNIILKLTKEQSQALELKLNDDDHSSEYKCFIVMRCWHPRAEEVVKNVKICCKTWCKKKN